LSGGGGGGAGPQGATGPTGPVGEGSFTLVGVNAIITNKNSAKVDTLDTPSSAYVLAPYPGPVTMSFSSELDINGNLTYISGGFSESQGTTSNSAMKYGIILNTSGLYLVEDGVGAGGGMYADRNTIASLIYDGQRVKYYKDGVLIYTSTLPQTNPLYATVVFVSTNVPNLRMRNFHADSLLLGPIGFTGFTGATGLDAKWNFKGEWTPENPYHVVGDIVTYVGIGFICVPFVVSVIKYLLK
jgi:hypothetical protein